MPDMTGESLYYGGTLYCITPPNANICKMFNVHSTVVCLFPNNSASHLAPNSLTFCDKFYRRLSDCVESKPVEIILYAMTRPVWTSLSQVIYRRQGRYIQCPPKVLEQYGNIFLQFLKLCWPYMSFAGNMDRDQAPRNVGSDLHSILFGTFIIFLLKTCCICIR